MQAMLEQETAIPTVVAQAILEATHSTFSTICKGDCDINVSPTDDKPCAGVMGVISFVGDMSFSYALVLPEPTAVKLANTFAGFPIPFDSADMGDVIGELANVVAGDIVARLDAIRVKVQMSLPAVMRGHDVEIMTPGNVASLRMNFKTTDGAFWLKLVAARPGVFQHRQSGS